MNVSTIQAVYEKLQHISPLGRSILQHLIEPQDEAILDALSSYQNEDGGFGHGLEADIQLPDSNVASTNVAITILETVADSPRKTRMIQSIVSYFEGVYDERTCSFPIVPPTVDDYPHAVWWNSDSLDGFTYGNPNPEVLGFLLQNQSFLSTINLSAFQYRVMEYIKTKMKEEASMHSVLSVCRLYQRGPDSLQRELYDYVQMFVHQFVETDESKWSDYTLEPYKVYLIVPEFLSNMREALEANIQKYETLLPQTIIRANWSWGQYLDVFDVVKDDWTPLIQYDILQAIKRWRAQ